jgi:hypothetical protein
MGPAKQQTQSLSARGMPPWAGPLDWMLLVLFFLFGFSFVLSLLALCSQVRMVLWIQLSRIHLSFFFAVHRRYVKMRAA